MTSRFGFQQKKSCIVVRHFPEKQLEHCLRHHIYTGSVEY